MGPQGADAGKFRVGPLLQQLAHHPALEAPHGAIAGITPIPIGHGQRAAGPQHPQQFIAIALLIGHVGAGLHAPYRIHTGLWQIQVEGVHHRKTAIQPWRSELLGPLDLGRTDADAQHLETVVAGEDAGAAPDAAAHIQHPAASR